MRITSIPPSGLRSLSTPPPLVKFCGMTRREDVFTAVDLGAAAVGFIMWPRSPRAVTPEQVRELVRATPPLIATVGVFVDDTVERVREIVEFTGLSAVQLHGAETPANFITLDGDSAIGVRLIKALGEPDADLAADASRWPAEVMLLVDAIDPLRRGGTGVTSDWARAAQLARTRRVILAGGLRPDNVADAIARVGPYAVDVSSGVEIRPGIKDAATMAAFMDAVRGAEMPPRVEHVEQVYEHGDGSNAFTD